MTKGFPRGSKFIKYLGWTDFKSFLYPRTCNSLMCYGMEEERNVRGVSESYLTLETLLEHLQISYRLYFLMAYILGIISRALAHVKSECVLCSVSLLSSPSAGRADAHQVCSSAARLWLSILQYFHTGWQMTASLSFQISPVTLALRLLLYDLPDLT